jgi:hypothetical protein
MTAAYTWSKSIDVACSGFFGAEACSVQNEYALNNDRSVSAFDVPHNLVVSWIYEVPFGRGKRFTTNNNVVDYIIGGWQFNGIMALRNGIPYHVTVPGDIANIFNSGTYLRANLVGDHRVDNPTPERWINTSAFGAPDQFNLRQPWAKQSAARLGPPFRPVAVPAFPAQSRKASARASPGNIQRLQHADIRRAQRQPRQWHVRPGYRRTGSTPAVAARWEDHLLIRSATWPAAHQW